ncbi:MAG TPA: hypothetical protein PLZ77_08965 [Lachnospiraceae bacterium]|nr:hypothetical protein [Lachnospiraceae bacterium]HPF30214.1 hypothetical protein [Lachnospiraceae bacterium]
MTREIELTDDQINEKKGMVTSIRKNFGVYPDVPIANEIVPHVKLRKDRAVVGAKVTDCNSSGCPLYESGIQILTLVELPDGCAYCVSG